MPRPPCCARALTGVRSSRDWVTSTRRIWRMRYGATSGTPPSSCGQATTPRCRSCTRPAASPAASLPSAGRTSDRHQSLSRRRTVLLSVNVFVSLDGVMQAPGAPDEDPSNGFDRGGWLVPYASAYTNSVVESWFREADAFLFGRTSYGL